MVSCIEGGSETRNASFDSAIVNDDKKERISDIMKSAVAVVSIVACHIAFAGVTATWTGEQDCYWTNAANWLVDGAVPERCPGVVTGEVAAVTGPNQTCGLPSRDIAVFDGTCTNGSTIINLDGLYSVQSVTVCG